MVGSTQYDEGSALLNVNAPPLTPFDGAVERCPFPSAAPAVLGFVAAMHRCARAPYLPGPYREVAAPAGPCPSVCRPRSSHPLRVRLDATSLSAACNGACVHHPQVCRRERRVLGMRVQPGQRSDGGRRPRL